MALVFLEMNVGRLGNKTGVSLSPSLVVVFEVQTLLLGCVWKKSFATKGHNLA